ncbi:MAG: multicopper oxidase family protein [Planctomycetes bacterium]|nr:multicopper oxidase family protein [Planctomycetota bacterium]
MVLPFRAAGACLFLFAPLLAQGTVDVTLAAARGTVDLGPGFTAEPAMLYDGTLPGPTIHVTEGQQLRIRFHNRIDDQDTTVHFHGQPLPLRQDGMSEISQNSIAPGQEHLYEFPSLQPGTYWFHPHSHHHMEQLDSGLYGVLIVDPANPVHEPPADVDRVIVLDDWLQPFGTGFSGHLMNGKSSLGQSPIVVQPGQKLRLRFLNAAATTTYAVSLDGHPMTVTHTDGYRVQPVTVQTLPIGVGERYDVIVDCSNPGIWSLAASSLQNRYATLVRGVVQYAGQTGAVPTPTFVPPSLSTGTLLNYGMLASLLPNPILPATRTQPAVLGMQMSGGNMLWTINGQAFPNITPMPVRQGDVVQVDFSNPMPMMSMYHPMHLHGHSFRVLGTAGGVTHAPLKDTLLLHRSGQPWSIGSVQFTADNPGRWMIHCHDQMHMMNGMVALFDYQGDADGDGLADAHDRSPTQQMPILSIPEMAMAFTPGAADMVSVQWQPGQRVDVLTSLTDAWPPIPMAPWGSLYLAPGTISLLGTTMVGASGEAQLGYQIPASMALSGMRIGLQALAGTSLANSVRLSNYQAFSIR